MLNVGTAAQVFTVTSGTEIYWKSTDCQVDAVYAQVSSEPNTPATRARRPGSLQVERTRAAASGPGARRGRVVPPDQRFTLAESDATKQFLLY